MPESLSHEVALEPSKGGSQSLYTAPVLSERASREEAWDSIRQMVRGCLGASQDLGDNIASNGVVTKAVEALL
ncbi:MAG: hypothetical protein PHW86_05480 [Candidatus Bipolaricaulis sp.]|nr:hypothetical protein [Candidatus Bipolaricaulis sp.]